MIDLFYALALIYSIGFFGLFFFHILKRLKVKRSLDQLERLTQASIRQGRARIELDTEMRRALLDGTISREDISDVAKAILASQFYSGHDAIPKIDSLNLSEMHSERALLFLAFRGLEDEEGRDRLMADLGLGGASLDPNVRAIRDLLTERLLRKMRSEIQIQPRNTYKLATEDVRERMHLKRSAVDAFVGKNKGQAVKAS